MIRINLLPQAKRTKAAATSSGDGVTGWVALYAATFFVSVAACAIVYFGATGELSEQQARNRELQTRISRVTADSATIDDVRAALERSRQLERVVTELQRARFGPTRALVELSRILSAGGGPTIDAERLEALRRENPLAGFNRTWDMHRLWLTSFEESNRAVRIHGVGKTHDDVAEFLRRLTLSESFTQVRLAKTETIEDRETQVALIAFEVAARVRY